MRSNGAVVIVAVTNDSRIILVEQYRAPVGRRCLELPAGIAGDSPEHAGEALSNAAARELLEETGYQAERLEHLFEGPPSAGLSSEVVTFYRAFGVTKVAPGGGDGHEQIIVHAPRLDEVDDWLKRETASGAYVDPKVYAGLYFVQR
jgi:ADP-ribose pyrophosphatase